MIADNCSAGTADRYEMVVRGHGVLKFFAWGGRQLLNQYARLPPIPKPCQWILSSGPTTNCSLISVHTKPRSGFQEVEWEESYAGRSAISCS